LGCVETDGRDLNEYHSCRRTPRLLAKARASARCPFRRSFAARGAGSRFAPFQARGRAVSSADAQNFHECSRTEPWRPSRQLSGSTTMTRSAAHSEPDGAPLRGICLVVKNQQPSRDRKQPLPAAGSTAKFPRRPDSGVLSASIPLFFIGRNRSGLWIAREAEGRSGGIFLFKRSAFRFAQRRSAPIGCATMILAERFELDVENQGSPLVARLDKVLRRVRKLIPDYPPPIPIRRGIFEGERR